MSHMKKNLLLGRSPKTMRLSVSDFEPLKWSEFFDAHENVTVNGGDFHYYTRGQEGPLMVTVHGGGHSALTWALFAVEITSRIQCKVLAIDMRGHGNTNTDNDDNLSLEQLAKDLVAVVEAVNKDKAPTILVGHSLGGAVIVEAAPLLPTTIAMCVIDIVEGTAMDALTSMQSLLRARPASFSTVQSAVQWGYRGGVTHNLRAARVSMPGQIVNSFTGKLASDEVEEGLIVAATDMTAAVSTSGNTDIIHEVDEIGVGDRAPPAGQASTTSMGPPVRESASATSTVSSVADCEIYDWRIDLTKTERFWTGWFDGLSAKFLNIPLPKMLLLANISGLDTSLTVGQMQGKFQLQVLTRSGHAIHEDHPDEVADMIATYMVRQRLTAASDSFSPSLPNC